MSTRPRQIRPNPIDVVLVTAPRCHFCDDATRILTELATTYPLDIRTVALTSSEGSALALRFRVPFPPILVVDGEYVGHGRPSRRRLLEILGVALQRRSEI